MVRASRDYDGPAVEHTPSEILVFSRAGARDLDRAASAELGMPSILLMENAAVAVAQACVELIAARGLRRIGVVCGPGNNGGDGLALARHLANRGVDPLVALAAAPGAYRGDAAVNLHIVEQMGLRVLDPIVSLAPQCALEILHRDGRDHSGDRDPKDVLVVDALVGTGLDRPVSPPMDQAIRWMNSLRGRGATTVAVDIPTGLDCDSGRPLGPMAVRADVTVTLAGLKRGFLEPQSREYTGGILVGDIGVPVSLMKRFALDPRFR